MNQKKESIILGIILVAIGIRTIIKEDFYSMKFSFRVDYGHFHGIVGLLFVVVGGMFIYFSVKDGKKNNEK